MKLRRLIIATVLLGAAALAQALEVKPYTSTALEDAQKADRPVALHFHADWCPTCRAQSRVLEQLKAEPGLDLTVLVANYDTEKDLKRRLKVRAQSTLIVLRGQTEWARLVGETAPESIRAALRSAL